MEAADESKQVDIPQSIPLERTEHKQPDVPLSAEPKGTRNSRNSIECTVDWDLKAFRLNRVKGGTLTKGGYGFSISRETLSPDGATTKVCHEYLFIEEVVYLFERGLILVRGDPTNDDCYLDSFELYNLLEPFGMPFPVYLVYAYLRSQTYRVFRYSDERNRIIEEMEDLLVQKDPSVTVKEFRKTQEYRRLVLEMREAIASAPVPLITTSGRPSVAFDVHRPDFQGFSRSSPGFPDFYCCITYFNDSDIDFGTLRSILSKNCGDRGISLKVAAVSTGGSVLMLSVTDSGVPSIHTDHA